MTNPENEQRPPADHHGESDEKTHQRSTTVVLNHHVHEHTHGGRPHSHEHEDDEDDDHE